jgi:hypothetical protein
MACERRVSRNNPLQSDESRHRSPEIVALSPQPPAASTRDAQVRSAISADSFARLIPQRHALKAFWSIQTDEALGWHPGCRRRFSSGCRDGVQVWLSNFASRA